MANGTGMSQEARESVQVLAQRMQTNEAALQEVRHQFGQLNDKMDTQARNSGEKIDTLFRSLDQRLSTQIESISRELGKQVEAVNEKVNTGRIPNYAVVLGFLVFMVTLLGTLYAFVSTPIANNIAEIRQIIAAERAERNDQLQDIRSNLVPRSELTEKSRIAERDIDSIRNDIDGLDKRFVTREETDVARGRAAEDRAQIDVMFNTINSTMVSRAEWQERNGSRDHEITNLMTAMGSMRTDLQRQLDQLRIDVQTLSNSLGNGRDTIQNMRDQIDKMQEQLLRFVGRGTRMNQPATQ